MTLHPALASLARRAAPRPAVVAPVSDPETLAWLEEDPSRAAAHCDLVELRADGLPGAADRLARLARALPVPVLATVRRPDEGGLDGTLDDAARRELFRRLLPHAALVDVELASLPALGDVVAEARGSGVAVVLSFHDFAGQGSPRALEACLAEMAAAGADVGKLAVTPGSWAQLLELAALAHGGADRPPARSVMGMGAFGRISRLVCAAGGSILNYGFFRGANAPGQWPAADFRRLLGQLAPPGEPPA